MNKPFKKFAMLALLAVTGITGASWYETANALQPGPLHNCTYDLVCSWNGCHHWVTCDEGAWRVD